ncbi:MAG: DUF1549 domain-containing protein, partial [Acidobacteriaceae bacterium]|nr:DUF1549 domain-containing protein [Acidobacteriaceae bacterium]
MFYRKLLRITCFLSLPCTAQTIDFAAQVQPILQAKCGACHGGDKRSGGFTIREYHEMLKGGRSGASLVPGDSKQSLLIERVNGSRQPQMPLGGAPLSAAEVAVIATWVDEGARLTPGSAAAKMPWVAKLQLTAPAPPESQYSHPVDRFLDRYFAARGETMPALVSDAVFARRVYLDAWGLLPSPEDLDRFVGDTSPHKREQLVDRLLSSNRNYAEHWMSFWNDLLRNDGGDNYHGGRKSITPWLYQALENNEPYDRFVAELLNPVVSPS